MISNVRFKIARLDLLGFEVREFIRKKCGSLAFGFFPGIIVDLGFFRFGEGGVQF